MNRNIKSLAADELILATENAVKNERLATAEVVRHFQEISDRKLFLERGYASLFDMATQYFGYCASAAQRRINSMRLIRDLPEAEEKIATGELTLTAAANIQSFFYAEKKENKPYSKEQKLELVKACLNKSTREVERELVLRNPQHDKRESLRMITEDRLRLSISISAELSDKIDHLKNLMSHSSPSMRTEDLLEKVIEMALDKLDPIRINDRIAKRQASKDSRNESSTRH